jgi:hypothetical protein
MAKKTPARTRKFKWNPMVITAMIKDRIERK